MESYREASPLYNIFFPPHAKNTSPNYGEGDKGGEVNKQSKFSFAIPHPATVYLY
jgi:hypothetical protein